MKKFYLFKKHKLQNHSDSGNTPPFEFFCRFAFDSTNFPPITNSESQGGKESVQEYRNLGAHGGDVLKAPVKSDGRRGMGSDQGESI